VGWQWHVVGAASDIEDEYRGGGTRTASWVAPLLAGFCPSTEMVRLHGLGLWKPWRRRERCMDRLRWALLWGRRQRFQIMRSRQQSL